MENLLLYPPLLVLGNKKYMTNFFQETFFCLFASGLGKESESSPLSSEVTGEPRGETDTVETKNAKGTHEDH